MGKLPSTFWSIAVGIGSFSGNSVSIRSGEGRLGCSQFTILPKGVQWGCGQGPNPNARPLEFFLSNLGKPRLHGSHFVHRDWNRFGLLSSGGGNLATLQHIKTF